MPKYINKETPDQKCMRIAKQCGHGEEVAGACYHGELKCSPCKQHSKRKGK